MLAVIVQERRAGGAIPVSKYDRRAQPGAFIHILKIHRNGPALFRDAHLMIRPHMVTDKILKFQLDVKHDFRIGKILFKG